MKFLAKLIAVIIVHAILLAIFGPIALGVATGIILANGLLGANKAITQTKTGVTGYETSAPTPAYTAPKKDKLIEIKPNQFKIG